MKKRRAKFFVISAILIMVQSFGAFATSHKDLPSTPNSPPRARAALGNISNAVGPTSTPKRHLNRSFSKDVDVPQASDDSAPPPPVAQGIVVHKGGVDISALDASSIQGGFDTSGQDVSEISMGSTDNFGDSSPYKLNAKNLHILEQEEEDNAFGWQHRLPNVGNGDDSSIIWPDSDPMIAEIPEAREMILHKGGVNILAFDASSTQGDLDTSASPVALQLSKSVKLPQLSPAISSGKAKVSNVASVLTKLSKTKPLPQIVPARSSGKVKVSNVAPIPAKLSQLKNIPAVSQARSSGKAVTSSVLPPALQLSKANPLPQVSQVISSGKAKVSNVVPGPTKLSKAKSVPQVGQAISKSKPVTSSVASVPVKLSQAKPLPQVSQVISSTKAATSSVVASPMMLSKTNPLPQVSQVISSGKAKVSNVISVPTKLSESKPLPQISQARSSTKPVTSSVVPAPTKLSEAKSLPQVGQVFSKGKVATSSVLPSALQLSKVNPLPQVSQVISSGKAKVSNVASVPTKLSEAKPLHQVSQVISSGKAKVSNAVPVSTKLSEAKPLPQIVPARSSGKAKVSNVEPGSAKLSETKSLPQIVPARSSGKPATSSVAPVSTKLSEAKPLPQVSQVRSSGKAVTSSVAPVPTKLSKAKNIPVVSQVISKGKPVTSSVAPVPATTKPSLQKDNSSFAYRNDTLGNQFTREEEKYLAFANGDISLDQLEAATCFNCSVEKKPEVVLRNLMHYLPSKSKGNGNLSINGFGSSAAMRLLINSTEHVVAQRLDVMRVPLGVAAGDDFVAEKGLWLKGSYSYTDQKTIGDEPGYNVRQRGFIIGADRDFSEKSVLGFALGKFNSKASSKELDNDTEEVSTIVPSIYYEYSPKPNFMINTRFNYAFAKINHIIHHNSKIRSYGKTRADLWKAHIEAIYGYKKGKVILSPKVAFSYDEYHVKEYVRRINIDNKYILKRPMEGRRGKKIVSSFGMGLKRNTKVKSLNITPKVHFNVNYILKRTKKAHLLGAVNDDIQTTILDLGKHDRITYNLGGYLNISRAEKVELGLGYDYNFRKGFRNHSSFASLFMKF